MRAAAIVVLALAGCTNFDFIDANQCGNGILEDGEDCDLVPGAPLAETCVACRHACVDDANQCPPGWGCGDDRVCRHGTLQFDELIAPIDVAVTDFVIDDLDGDPFPDAIGYGPTEIWLARGTPGPGFEIVDRYARTRPDLAPVIGDLDGSAFLLFDELANPRVTLDLAMSTGPRGVAMFRTVSGRLVPAPQPWFRLGVRPNATIPIRTAASAPHHELVRVGDDPQLALAIEHPDHAPSIALVPVVPGCNVNLVELAAGDLDGDGHDELVVGCELNDELLVFGTVLDGDGVAQLVELTTLILPEQLRGPIVLGDLDGDDVPDVLATTAADLFAPIEHFAVFRQTAPLVFAPATQDARLGGDTVLAMADLDGDGTTDVIGDGGAYLATGAALDRALTAPATWLGAAAADVNGDDLLDVIGASNGRLDTLVARGDGTYTLHVALTTGLFEQLAIGDLDGDGLDDAATVWRRNTDSAVQILYGRDSGGFDALVSAGALLANVTGFAAADLVVPGSLLAADGAADLVMSIQDQVFVFAGSGARPPLASLDTGQDPRLIALGRFDPFAAQESLAGLDVLALGADRAHATVFYGNATAIRELDDRYAMDALVPYCTMTPPVFTVANVNQFGGAELIEATCLNDGPYTAAWEVYGFPPPTTAFNSGATLAAANPTLLATADLDGDLARELIAANDGGNQTVRIYHNRGTVLEATGAPALADYVRGFAVGNLDDDLALELLVGGEAFATAFDYDAGTGPTALLDPDEDPLDLIDWRFVEPGVPRLVDLDGDGVLDLVLGEATLRAFRGKPNRE